MFTRTIAVAAAIMLFAAPASAFYCPKSVEAIEHALSKNWEAYGPRLSGAQIAEVTKLRDQGLAQHIAEKHQDGIRSLSEAVRIILNSM